MSHRKIRSYGYIPFSWEEQPGIPKFNINHQKSSSDLGLSTLKIMHDRDYCSSNSMIPPPPCTYSKPRRKSFSGNWWEDDPFVSALKSCSKSSTVSNHQELKHKDKGNNKRKTIYNIKSSVFSCKNSCDVEDDNLVKFSKFPPLPKERYNAKSFVVKRSDY